LTVLNLTTPDPQRGARCLCRCDCGTEKELPLTYLRQGTVKSCGCLNRGENNPNKYRLPPGEADKRRVLSGYRYGARRRGLAFEITCGEAEAILTSPCHYCGEPPKPTQTTAKLHGHCSVTGIDRKNPKLGYVPGNVTSACGQCNRGKGTLTTEEFDAWLSQIAAFREQTNRREARSPSHPPETA
jgi:5-methylcytosine-specific restriction endonuclease McrA